MTRLDNPFSPLAVARATGFNEVTVETDAIRDSHAAVRGYLETSTTSAEGASVHSGNVLAIVGDHGTGKTHLAGWLLNHVRADSDNAATAIYLDSPAGRFTDLFKAFLDTLGLDAVQARIRELYADIVADAIAKSSMTSDVVQWLKNGEIEPRLVVERLGLTESRLLRRVEETLLTLTGDESLSKALVLLLRPGFEDAVWRWAHGAPPEPILTDRGVSASAGSDRAALDMWGAFTLLMGGQQRRLVIVVDEFHEILGTLTPADVTAMEGFQSFLGVFSSANAFLVLAGVPDMLAVLSSGVRQRIGRTIFMPGLTAPEVCKFISDAQERQFGEARLSPFTQDAVAYMVNLSGGRVRTVIRFCHDLFGLATSRGVPVSEDMVDEVARGQLGTNTEDDVTDTIRKALDGRGMHYLPHHYAAGPEAVVDFWLPFGNDGNGCAVLLSRSLLVAADVGQLAARTQVISGSSQEIEFVIVVNGVVSPRVELLVRETFRTYPLVYRPRQQFADEFMALVDSVTMRLTPQSEVDPMDAVAERIDRLNRQQVVILSALERLTGQWENSQSTADRRLATIHRELDELSATVKGLPSAGSRSTTRLSLPAEVDRLFTEAVSLLDKLIELNGAYDNVFPSGPADARAESALTALQDHLRSSALIAANGAAAALRQALLAFQRRTAAWYHSDEVRTTTGPLTDDADDQLYSLCKAYDATAEYIPIDRLEPLIRRGGRSDLVSGVSQSLRRADLDGAFDILSVRVRRELLKHIFAHDNR